MSLSEGAEATTSVESHNSRAFSLTSFAFLLSEGELVACRMNCTPYGNCNSLCLALCHGIVQ